MELIGKPPINPLLFYTGKISGYITWISFIYNLTRDGFGGNLVFNFTEIVAFSLFALGLIFSVVSILDIGSSIRLGLPNEDTVLKSKGIYRISRNPMYVGFGLFTISSMIYTMNYTIIALGLFSLVVYHLIIKSEEKFLLNRFGDDYEVYRKKVKRYL
ncbi:MAG: isoprenylcysteine carboxylmethyltransferase family protein [Proteiniphilum sp.]|jgi:protein-S-isoprenylcysteine O-methyltransferase Ste14|nr:isoprenylcysteine carboxylmethyltransferase family protein [Synergistaceae bacterium]MDD2265185.1 isoprenylcysteine carboxylmethyltransferase family protein [Bacteroidales bacterium]MDY0183805.1 isoprenylcysteine carboxylmethyltransferase family protein [Proteiniphilum sp.]MDD4474160.1 isoprenylcysteine carboxylmethyltransferase family protein [Bacteroidales bacterium]MDD5517724.1 isoprenylcysteine carboxylmethyltransferase family protein [Bacteroidales bacterium]